MVEPRCGLGVQVSGRRGGLDLHTVFTGCTYRLRLVGVCYLRGVDIEEVVMMWAYAMSGFGWLVMLAWWVLVIAGILWLVRSVGGDRGGARRQLDERFAAGELSVDEYQQRRRALG